MKIETVAVLVILVSVGWFLVGWSVGFKVTAHVQSVQINLDSRIQYNA